MAPPTTAPIDVLRELEPVVAANLDRHLSVAKEWMPHDYVPWSRGRDFDSEPWAVEQSGLSDVAQVAFELNLLTEDNLPSYHREIYRGFGRDGAWGTWVHRWTAEEGRHAIAMRDYLLVTRGVDPVELERNRMTTMETGFSAGDRTSLGVLAYVSFQELATRISHRNTGRYTQDPIADKLLARIAADENLHMVFYRDLVRAALEIAPSESVTAVCQEIIGFKMPGAGIVDFDRKAKQIAWAGIYDLRIHHDEVVWPILRNWDLFEIEGLDGAAEKAREDAASYLATVDRLATRYDARRSETLEREAVRTEPVPV